MHKKVNNGVPIFGLENLLGALASFASIKPYLSALLKKSSLPFIGSTYRSCENIMYKFITITDFQLS